MSPTPHCLQPFGDQPALLLRPGVFVHEDDPAGLSRFQFQHAAAQRMPLNLATKSGEGPIPCLTKRADGHTPGQDHHVDGIRPRAARRVRHERWAGSAHVGQESLRDDHIRHHIPRPAVAALVGGAGFPASGGFQVFLDAQGHTLAALKAKQEVQARLRGCQISPLRRAAGGRSRCRRSHTRCRLSPRPQGAWSGRPSLGLDRGAAPPETAGTGVDDTATRATPKRGPEPPRSAAYS